MKKPPIAAPSPPPPQPPAPAPAAPDPLAASPTLFAPDEPKPVAAAEPEATPPSPKAARPRPAPGPAPEPVPTPEPMIAAAPPPPTPQPQIVAAPAAPPAPTATQQPELDFPKTIKDTLRKVDESWSSFRAAAMRFPSERMDERIAEESWTRKQMLQHVAAWHDLTADRLLKLINTGQPAALDRDADQFNASVARQAIGKTSGEVLKDMDATFNRLRRQLARLTDAQLTQDDWWAAWVVGGNTYGHYEEHWADIYTPEAPQGGGRNRR